jgi:hypothetical protein
MLFRLQNIDSPWFIWKILWNKELAVENWPEQEKAEEENVIFLVNV